MLPTRLKGEINSSCSGSLALHTSFVSEIEGVVDTPTARDDGSSSSCALRRILEASKHVSTSHQQTSVPDDHRAFPISVLSFRHKDIIQQAPVGRAPSKRTLPLPSHLCSNIIIIHQRLEGHYHSLHQLIHVLLAL
jgi:hypothetical protein